MALFKAQGLEKTYYTEDGEIAARALAGADFEIKKGEFVAIMGPSGSGKSTLLQIVGFLDDQTKGDYLFEGRKAAKYNEEEKAHIRNKKMGFVFQAFNLLARTTVLENVKLPLVYSDIPESKWDEQAKKAIESVGLSHRLDHEPSQLSGGEKQRVAIARALVNDPEVIFADEPTGNLDSKSGKLVMEAIEDLHSKGGRTIVLITHETSTAQHAERILKMKDGVIISDTKVKGQLHAHDSYEK